MPAMPNPLVVGSLVDITIGMEGGWAMAETNRRNRRGGWMGNADNMNMVRRPK